MITKRVILLLLLLITKIVHADMEKAIFAGGCFWCVESDFSHVHGVTNIVVGFDGGLKPKNPSYLLVSSGSTDYVESVEITYDPKLVSYKQLLDFYWRHIDPTAKDSQFCDKGRQYRSIIFYLNEEQKKQATESFDYIRTLFPVVNTEITPSTNFYPADEEHQHYFQKHKYRYKFYRYSCGRDKKVQEVWSGK